MKKITKLSFLLFFICFASLLNAQNYLDVLGLTSSDPSPVSFGLRKLSSTYSGNLIMVRRSNDNATQNIGFTANGDLDTASLKTFVGANNGFIDTWYDQSGNSRHATQATNSLQPQVINAGVIYRIAGKPTLYFNNQKLATASFSNAYNSAFVLAICGGVQTNTTYSTFGAKTTGSGVPSPFDMYNNFAATGNGTAYRFTTLTNPINSNYGFNQWTFKSNSSHNLLNYRNGYSIGNPGPGAIFTYSDNNAPLIIGSRADGATSLIGWISEFVTLSSDISNTNRALVETNQIAYNGGAITELTGLSFSIGSISPSFDLLVSSYLMTVNTATTTLTATTAIPTATVQLSLNGGAYANIPNGSSSQTLNLVLGSNTLNVKVIGTDGVSSQIYTTAITRTPYLLNNIGLDGSNVSPAAFALRKLSSSFPGYALKIRRSSDNLTTNIGFTNTGDLDIASIQSFVGNGNGFVETWYDQSGYDRHATQSVFAKQPMIVTAGAIVYKNGKPTLKFSGTNSVVNSLNTPAFSGAYSTGFTLAICGGVNAVSNVNYSTFGSKSAVNIASPWEFYNNSFYSGNGTSTNVSNLNNGLNVASGFAQWTFSGSSAAQAYYKNSVSNGSGGSSFYGDGANSAISIGSRQDEATTLDGWISEYVTFPSVLSNGNRNIVENNQKSYFTSNGILYVKTSSSGLGDGSSWANATSDLQAAINTTGVNEIWVAAGTYKPTLDPNGAIPATLWNRAKTFSLVNNQAIYGGFIGTETSRNQRNATSNVTILSGDIGTVTVISDNCYHVVTSVSDNSSTILDGFTITGGNGDNTVGNYYTVETKTIYLNEGGGIHLTASSPTLNNIVFTANYGYYGGGIFANDYSQAIISNCSFSSNSAIFGGAIYNNYAGLTINNSSFLNNSLIYYNSTYGHGGAIYNLYSNCVISNNVFTSNSTVTFGGGGGYGGAIYNENSGPSITSCTFASNSSGHGGAIYNNLSNMVANKCFFYSNSVIGNGGAVSTNSTYPSLSFTNCVLANNSAAGLGGAFYVLNSDLTLINSTAYGNTSATSNGRGFMYCENTIGVSAIRGITIQNCNITNSTNGELYWGSNIIMNRLNSWFDILYNYFVTFSIGSNNYNGGTHNFRNTSDMDGADNIWGTRDDGLIPLSTDGSLNTGTSGPADDATGFARVGIVDLGAYEINSQIYLKPTASGTEDGSSWANATSDLQAAINNAGTSVWVAAGTYKPAKDPSGNASPTDSRDKTFYLKNGVTLYGGFAGTETSLAERNMANNVTILSGDIGTVGVNTDNCYHVVLSVSDGNSTGLNGVTITGGYANGTGNISVESITPFRNEGGGVYCLSSSPTFTNLIVNSNSAVFGGGLNNNSSCSPIITNTVFSNNAAISNGSGGGMYNSYSSSPNVSSTNFITNTAGYGGGMYNSSSTAGLNLCVFSGNVASSNGGAMLNDGVASVIINSVFSGNTANYGGAILNYNSASTFTNCTVYNNSATTDGGAFYNNTSAAGIKNTIIWGNTGGGTQGIANLSSTPTVSYSIIQGSYSGTGNSSANPLFVNASDPDGADNVWRNNDDGLYLQNSSTAINAGTLTGAPTNDITELVRTGNPDMGAYEFNSSCAGGNGFVVFVKPTASGTGNGSSWANATNDLQAAINNTCGITEIWVAAGTYKPIKDVLGNLSPSDSRDKTFIVNTGKSGMKIYGGFVGTETLLSQRNSVTNTTILSGDIGVTNTWSDNCYHVLIVSNNSNVIIDGFQISYGNAIGTGTSIVDTSYSPYAILYAGRNSGGAIYLTQANVNISNCNVYNNGANYGAGIYSENFSNWSLTNSNVSSNTALLGGGMFTNSNAYSSINNTVFYNNFSSNSGGGIYCALTTTNIINNSYFYSNAANINGGGINNLGNLSITNNVFTSNSSQNGGGGGLLNDGTSCFVRNSTFYNNYGGSNGGGGILNGTNRSIDISNTIIYGNTVSANFGFVAPAYSNDLYNVGSLTLSYTLLGYTNLSGGTGNLFNFNPQFVNQNNPIGLDGIWGTADDGLMLIPTSGLVNRASSSILLTDIRGITRVGNPDWGAYETVCPTYNGVIYAKPVSSGTGDGSSWANATADLQSAINNACGVSTIWLAAGTYYPTRDVFNSYDPADARDKTFYLINGIKLNGGFAGTETLLSQRNIASNVTILSGDIGATSNASDNSYHVLTSISDENGTNIDGITVIGGNANGSGYVTIENSNIYRNAGAAFIIVNSSPNIASVVFSSNQALYGGAVYAVNTSSPIISNSIFTTNSATSGFGGALYCGYSSSPLITATSFNSNSAANGGAVYNYSYSLPIFSNCNFSSNTATTNGGAIANEANSSPSISHSVFNSNTAAYGGAVLNLSSSPTITNSTFYANNASSDGGAFYNHTSPIILKNCILWGNTGAGTQGISNTNGTPTVTYSIVQGGFSGTGNLSTNPVFANTADPDGADNTWRTSDDGLKLSLGSAAYNAGNNTGAATTDMIGTTIPQFTTVDMGAYESTSDLSSLTLDNLGLASGIVSPAAFSLRRLSSNYSGSAIQVRRNNDNTTSNIGFTASGDLDTATLKTFVGANNGFVTIWYDQSGLGRNAIQATTGSQPQIISAGVIYRKNGRPTIYFNSQSLATASFTGFSSAFSLAICAGVNSNTTYPTFGSKNSSNIAGPWEYWGSTFYYGNNSTQTGITLTNGINASSGFSQWSFSANASNGAAFRNGITNGTGGAISYNDGGNPFYIGTRGDGATSLNGFISEYVTLNSVLGTTDRQSVENNQMAYYNWSNANLATLTLSNGTISPAFGANTTSYTTSVSATSTTVNASLEVIEASIQVRINSGTYVSMANGGTSSALALNVGSNTIDVKVTAFDGSTLKTYTITVTRAISANALDFQQAGSNYINVPNSASLTLGSSFTIEAWVNYSGTSRTIIDKGAYDNLLSLNPAGDNKLGFYSANTGAWRYSTGTIPQNTWTHVAVTLSSGNLTFYINGVASGTGSVTPTSSTGALNIGRQGPTNCFCNAYNGSMDELRIWNVARTANQILSNLNNELNAQTGLVALYHFNQGFVGANNTSTVTALDESGNGNNGTLTSFTLTGSSSNWVQRTFSTDARLSNLTISSGTLAPVFDSAVISYTATVTNATSSITVTPTKVNAYATIQVRVNGGSYENVISGNTTSSLSLNVGTNTIEVLVTAQDGIILKTYTITVTRAISANALDFQQAGSNYINVPNSASLTLGSSFTIESWVNYSGTSRTIIDKGAYDNLLSLNPAGDNKLGFYSANTGAWRYSTGTIPQNTWTHVAVTLNSGTLTFYINGVASGTGSVTPTSSTGALNIGRQGPTNCFCNAYNGSMDELRIWNVARTANQILSNLNNELSAQTGLVALYHFNQGFVGANNTSTTTALDESGNGNNGTLTSFTLTGNTSNWVQRTFSTDARLSNLTISSGTLATVFDSAVISYTATVTNATSSITVTPIKVNDYATIQVRVNGGSYENVISGNATSSLPLNVGSNIINVLVTAQDGSTTKIYTITLSRDTLLLTWTGATNNTWNLATNWNPVQIPSSIDNVIVATSSNNPVLNTTNATRNITINSGATLTVNGILQIGSNLITLGTLNASSGSIVLNGLAAQTINANGGFVQNLTVNNSAGVTLTGALNLTGILTPTIGVLTTGGNLTLKSFANSSGSIASNLSGSNYISGNVMVERFVSGQSNRGRWRFLSSPVSNATVTNWMDQFYVTGPGDSIPANRVNGSTLGTLNTNGWHTNMANISFPNSTMNSNVNSVKTTSVRTYNEAVITGDINSGWENLTSNTQNLTPGKGFRAFIRGDRNASNSANIQLGAGANTNIQGAVNLTLTGTVNQGEINANPTFTSSGTINNDGWNLIGNPYPCSYNLFAHINAPSNSAFFANISPTVYVYSAVTGGYVSYNTAGSGTNAGLDNGIIPPGAAFFIKATGANPVFKFQEAYKTINSHLFGGVHKTGIKTEEFGIKYYADSTEKDYIVVKMYDGSTLNNDIYDIEKVRNDNLNLAAYGTDSVNLTATVIPQIVEETRIKLNVESTLIGTYHFDFTNMDNFEKDITVSLFDRYTNKTIDVKKSTTYTFVMDAGVNQWGKNRFELILNKTNTGTEDLTNIVSNAKLNIYPNPATDVLNINISKSSFKNSEVVVYNISGMEVIKTNMANNNAQLNIETLSNGVYFIKVSNQNGFNKTVKFVK